MFELPWWAWIIVGFFVGIVTELVLALVIIYLRNRGRTPAAIQDIENITKATGMYDIGKPSDTKEEIKVMDGYVCLRVDVVLKLANDMENAKALFEGILKGMREENDQGNKGTN